MTTVTAARSNTKVSQPQPKAQPQSKAQPQPKAQTGATSQKPASAAQLAKAVTQGTPVNSNVFHKEFNQTKTFSKSGSYSKQLFPANPQQANNSNGSGLSKSLPSASVPIWSGQTPNYSTQGLQAQGQFNKNGISGNGEVSALQAHAQGNANVTFDPAGMKVNAQAGGSAGANLLEAHGHVQNNYGTSADGQATVGANANGTANVTIDPLHGNVDAGAHLDANVGAEVGGQVSQQVGPVTATASGHLRAGLGANLDAEAGIHNGKLEAKFDVGATLGIGGDIGVDVSVDPKAALNAVSNGWHKLFG